jgi:hypothetical protein
MSITGTWNVIILIPVDTGTGVLVVPVFVWLDVLTKQSMYSYLISLHRLFNETPVNPRKCTAVLTKILYLLNQVS